MKNFILFVSGIIIVFFLIILITGQWAGSYFKFQTTVSFDVSQDLLWRVINDVDNYKNNKNNIVEVKKGEYYGESILSWVENYKFGISKTYEVIRRKDPEILILDITNSLTGAKTKLYFELSEDEKKTYLKITEESEVGNIFWAGLKVLSGRDAFVNSEIKWIRVALYNYLINK